MFLFSKYFIYALVIISFITGKATAQKPPSDSAYKQKSYAVQIASITSESGVRSFRKKFEKIHAHLIRDDQKLASYRADIKTKDGIKIYYRIKVIGFKDRKTAQILCKKLKLANQPCFVGKEKTSKERLIFASTNVQEKRKTNSYSSSSNFSWLPYESSTPIMDTIAFGILGLLFSNNGNSRSGNSNYIYDSSYTETSSNSGSTTQTSSSSNRQTSNKTGGYTITEHIEYGVGQKVVARGRCSDGTRFDVRYSPNTGASYQYTIYSTSGSSRDNVAKKFCRNH